MLFPLMRWLLISLLLTTITIACSSSSSAAGSSCQSAGGTCLLGGATCSKQPATGGQDCNPPPENPGGAFCCLVPADAQ
jgi:hypothetical protein